MVGVDDVPSEEEERVREADVDLGVDQVVEGAVDAGGITLSKRQCRSSR